MDDWLDKKPIVPATPEVARDMTVALLAARASDATVCPSEVARALAASPGVEAEQMAWRDLMPTVHAGIDMLLDQKQVRLSWKGQPLPARAGPYRIGRGAN